MLKKINLSPIKKFASKINFDFDFSNYFSENGYRVIIALIFTALFIPHTFIMIEDLNLISAYEVDPGSIIASIEDLFRAPYYSMLNGYHSKYYGWTFMAICFVTLLPLKLFLLLTGIKSKLLVYFTIRLVLFTIGLISSLLLFEILNKFTKNRLLPFLTTLLYVISPTSYLFYFIHPESTGTLFIFAAILFLINFSKKFDSTSYFLGLGALVLASLSKQIFLFASLPILFCFFHFYCQNKNTNYIKFISSKDFLRIFKLTFFTALAIFFIIHPYAFFKVKKFFIYQSELSTSFTSKIEVSLSESLSKWFALLKYSAIMYISFVTIPLVILFASYKYIKNKNPLAFLVIVNSFTALLCFFMVAFGNRFLYSTHYLQACFIFLLLNIFAIISYLTSLKNSFLRNSFKALSIYFLILAIFYAGYTNLPKTFDRLHYKEGSAYKTYSYIKNHVTMNDKIAHDHMVAVPVEMEKISCHFWRGCGSDYIEEFNPNYVMFDNKFSLVLPSKETQRLQKYIEDHKMVLIHKITAKHGNVVDQDIAGSSDIEIFIYKKQ